MILVNSINPILTTPCKRFNFTEPPFDPVEFSKELVAFLYEQSGLGLAANQVGVGYQIFAMRGSPENFVCFNPKIVDASKEEVLMIEGCLTYKHLYVKVKRPYQVRVRFQTPNSEIRTETFTGMTARVFQHEMDHLEGLRFFDKANRYHREQGFKKWKKNEIASNLA